ncbi:MAG: ATP-grasp domain-containing protein [Erysipelotrichaceae bacterium]
MNILLTSVGRRTYLINYFKEALGNKGKVYIANSTLDTSSFVITDNKVVTPLIYDDNYIPFLLNYCEINNIKAIISLYDIDLMILSKNIEKFESKGIKVVVSSLQVINICNDKWETYKFLKEKGINTPLSFIELNDAIENIESEKMRFPIIVKPRWGMGSIDIFQANNLDELIIFYKKLSLEIFDSNLKYESIIDKQHSVIIQEKIVGQEYGVDVINDLKGNYINSIVKKKFAMRAGETDCAETVYVPEIIAIGDKIGKELKHIANLDVDVFYDGQTVSVLEMNARFGGGYPFSHIAGVNLPLAIVLWLRDLRVAPELLECKLGIKGYKNLSIISNEES